MTVTPIRHGTYNGYHTEYNRGLPTCQACCDANAAYQRERKRKRQQTKCVAGLGWPVALDLGSI